MIEEIVQKLTKAQREALLSGDWTLARPLVSLLNLGLARRTGETEWPYWAELTPLGLAVKARLEEQDNEH